MPLTTIPKNLGDGGSGIDRRLYKILKEQQAKVLTCAVGAAANTNIAVAGITTADTIISVNNLTDGTPIAIGTASIFSTGNIRLTGATTSKMLLVEWTAKV